MVGVRIVTTLEEHEFPLASRESPAASRRRYPKRHTTGTFGFNLRIESWTFPECLARSYIDLNRCYLRPPTEMLPQDRHCEGRRRLQERNGEPDFRHHRSAGREHSEPIPRNRPDRGAWTAHQPRRNGKFARTLPLAAEYPDHRPIPSNAFDPHFI